MPRDISVRSCVARPSLGVAVAAALLLMASCGGGEATTTAAPTTTQPPATTAQPTTSGVQTLDHLRDGTVITEAAAGRRFAISLGDRAELRLSTDYAWTEPALAGPGELLPLDPGPGYLAWELVPNAQGSLVISATGTPDCGDGCNLQALELAISVAVRQR